MSEKRETELSIWMNGEPVGKWQIVRGIHQFTYEKSWYNFPGSRPISLSLPLQYFGYKHKGEVVENYFDNLLPDNYEIRRGFQARFGTSSTKAFDLLYEIGRDCIGAIQLLPTGKESPNIQTVKGREVSETEIEQILKAVAANTAFPYINNEEFRISLAGAQNKTAFTLYKNKWLKPYGATPSTHIFKLPLGLVGQNQLDLSNSTENEWLCLKLIEHLGLDTACSEIAYFGTIKALIVQRFDRKLSEDDWFIRLPQEDLCQVMGIPSGLKYENDGGIGIKKIMDFLLGSVNAETDRVNFFMSQILFWLLAAPDGHAKNFSIFIESRGRYRLTPFYDIMSAFPFMGKGPDKLYPSKLKMAMSVQGKNKHYSWDSISYRHWIETGRICGLSKKTVDNVLDKIIQEASDAIDSVMSLLPADFPEETAESIFKGFELSVKKLKC